MGRWSLVLFLFVVMMLDVNFGQLREGFQRYAPVGAAIGVVLLGELILTVGGWRFVPDMALHLNAATPPGVGNTVALGRLVYTDYVLLFQTAGLYPAGGDDRRDRADPSERDASRRQNIGVQQGRNVADTLEVMTIGLGIGTGQTGIIRPKAGAGAGGGA